MTTLSNRLRRAVIVAMSGLGIMTINNVAQAAGTSAGTSVDNVFTLTYDVGSISQPPITNGPDDPNATFTVDRRVDLSIVAPADATVTPGATGQELVFRVINEGNDNSAYRLTLVDEPNAPTGADQFDPTGLTIEYFVGDTDATFEPGGDDGAAQSYTLGQTAPTLDLPADASLWVRVTGNIPAALTDNDRGEVILTAIAADPAASPTDAGYSPPAAGTFRESVTSGSNTLAGAADTVLADGAGDSGEGGVAADGDFIARGAFVVDSAALTATKNVAIIATDGGASGFNCASDAAITTPVQFYAPGACIEYVIAVSNAAGAGATATNIDIADILPADVEFIGASHTFAVPGAGTPPTTSAGCPNDPCTVSLDDAELAAGASGNLIIRARVR